jgi:hypothetical protein
MSFLQRAVPSRTIAPSQPQSMSQFSLRAALLQGCSLCGHNAGIDRSRLDPPQNVAAGL